MPATDGPPDQRVRSLHSVNPLRRLLFGRPIPTEQQESSLLPKLLALPVFSSDAISSVVYATQEILLVLGAAGLWTIAHRQLYARLTVGITLGIVTLLIVVVASYWQTIYAYPSGGGSYIVSSANLGVWPGLIAAAALLIDYVLTVAVSIASGVQNLLDTPVMQSLQHQQTAFCILFVGLIALMNLRGLKESGTLFAIPTYLFVAMAGLLIVGGLFGPLVGWRPDTSAVTSSLPAGTYSTAGTVSGVALIALALKAFASGCAAMTGTEAVSNGIPAFRRPASRNAALTLAAMACILGGLFLGISVLATRLGVVYGHHGHYTSPAVIDQLSSAVFGRGTALYYTMQFATVALLVLAANTSFADFPRLASILSRDRFMPRQLVNQGDKLVFSNGVVLLALAAIGLIVAFRGSVDRLIPLYAIGVFTAFTLSQSGMVRHWLQARGRGWQVKATLNGLGALCTGIVLVVIASEKFHEGAWIVLVVVAIVVAMFRAINRHYERLRRCLSIIGWRPEAAPFSNTVLLLVPSLHRGVFPALEYARHVSSDCRGIHIEVNSDDTPRLLREWEEYVGEAIPLVVLPSPYRSFIGPLLAYLDQVQRESSVVTVVLPEFVPGKWWHGILHNANGILVKYYLGQRPGVVLTNVRYFLSDAGAAAP